MTIIKRFLILMLILAILLIAGSFIALQFVSKSFLEKQVQEATGRDFVIEGEMSPAISLMPSVSVSKVSLGNAKWGSRKEMANIGELDVQLALIPLFSGDVEISSLSIKNADIVLEQKGSRWNYEFSEAKETEGEDESGFELSALNVEDSTVTIRQGGDKTTIRAKSIKLEPKGDGSSFAYEGRLNDDMVKISFDTQKLSQFMATQKLVADNMKVEFGDYEFAGNADIDLSKAAPYIKATLKTDKLVLAGGADEPKQEGADDKLPFDSFEVVNGDIKLHIGELESDRIVVKDISAPVKIRDGVLSIKDMKAKFAEGTLESDISLSKAATSINLKGTGLMMEQILAQAADMNDFRKGPTDVVLSLKGSGDTVQKIKSSLSGQSDILMRDGVYNKKIGTGSVAEFQKLLGGGSSADSTPINCAIANVKWDAGTGRVEVMAVDTEYAYVLGKGRVKLGANEIDMVLSPKAKSPGLMSFAVPVAVRGKLDDPSFFPDPAGSVVAVGKGVAGFATGGLSVLANTVTDAIGVTGSKNPCAADIKQEESAPEATPEPETGAKAGVDAFKDLGKDIKENNPVKDLGEGLKGILKK